MEAIIIRKNFQLSMKLIAISCNREKLWKSIVYRIRIIRRQEREETKKIVKEMEKEKYYIQNTYIYIKGTNLCQRLNSSIYKKIIKSYQHS